jgi:hypothetical protein
MIGDDGHDKDDGDDDPEPHQGKNSNPYLKMFLCSTLLVEVEQHPDRTGLQEVEIGSRMLSTPCAVQ